MRNWLPGSSYRTLVMVPLRHIYEGDCWVIKNADNFFVCFTKCYQIALQNVFSSLNSHQQCMRIPISPNLCQYWGLSFWLLPGWWVNSGVLELTHESWLSTFLPNFLFSDFTLVAWNQQGWEYLYHGNWQTLQIRTLPQLPAVFKIYTRKPVAISSITLSVFPFSHY